MIVILFYHDNSVRVWSNFILRGFSPIHQLYNTIYTEKNHLPKDIYRLRNRTGGNTKYWHPILLCLTSEFFQRRYLPFSIYNNNQLKKKWFLVKMPTLRF